MTAEKLSLGCRRLQWTTFLWNAVYDFALALFCQYYQCRCDTWSLTQVRSWKLYSSRRSGWNKHSEKAWPIVRPAVANDFVRFTQDWHAHNGSWYDSNDTMPSSYRLFQTFCTGMGQKLVLRLRGFLRHVEGKVVSIRGVQMSVSTRR